MKIREIPARERKKFIFLFGGGMAIATAKFYWQFYKSPLSFLL
jgi:hypothetical protein